MTTKERFEISTEGFRELQQGRSPWSLIKELVQNVWDEAPQATICNLTIIPDTRPGHTLITVEDDGPGFANHEHAYVLMAPTSKRSDPTKRGRFNTGEKEAISVATEATITTKAKTIHFPESGGRVVTDNDQSKGTTITLAMPWDPSSIPELLTMLHRFIPTDCRLVVNGNEIPMRTPLKIHPATLPTIIQSATGQPMRYRNRKTAIHILEPLDKPGWIYEMGIPIQPTDLPYDVNVTQKVPMPPNRDTVGQPYLKHVSAEVLNAMYEAMPTTSFADTWVRTGIEDNRATDQAIIATKESRYGEKVVMWSSKTDANLKAAEAGYQVVHPRSLSPEERTKLTGVAGVRSANEIFKTIPPTGPPIEPTPPLRAFSNWVDRIAAFAAIKPTVIYVNSPKANFEGACSANTQTPIVTFNTAKLTPHWFASRGPAQLALVIHELAHAAANTPMEHGPKWGEACAMLGGKIADAFQNGRIPGDLA